MYVLNTLEVDGREYTAADAKKIVPIIHYDIEDGFYGGRVKYIGATNTGVLLLMDDPNSVIDTAVEDLESVGNKMLRVLLKRKKIEAGPRATKEDLITLLRG